MTIQLYHAIIAALALAAGFLAYIISIERRLSGIEGFIKAHCERMKGER